jgi:NADH-quinone oxidoreductase subunit L
VVHGLPLMHVVRGGETITQTLMENFLDPVFRTTNELIAQRKAVEIAEEHGAPWATWAFAYVLALVGGGSAVYVYGKRLKLPDFIEPFRKLSFNKFYVDELYELVLIRPLTFLSKVFFRVIDSIIIDGVGVRGTAWVTQRAGAMLRYFQTGDAQMYAAVMALAVAGGLVWALLRVAS